jgi:hypothetical protein
MVDENNAVGFREWTAQFSVWQWTAQFSVWQMTGKDSSEACATACQKCTAYSVFPSGMTSRSKIAQFNPLTPELSPSVQRCLKGFLLGILFLEPCISLIYVWKANKYTNYSFSLLIMYGSSYMFRHYIAILREHS